MLGALFAIVLLDASIIGAAAVTLSTSYAFGDVFGLKHSLHRKFRDAKPFYASYAAMIAVAAGVVLVPGAPLGLLTTAVQALAGVLLPSASVFLLLLCNDRGGARPVDEPPLAERPRQRDHRRAADPVRHPGRDHACSRTQLRSVAIWLVALLVAAARRGRRVALAHPVPPAAAAAASARRAMSWTARQTWRMPPLALLKPVTWSPGTKLGMLMLRGYLVISVLLLIVKAVQLGGG